MFMFMFIFISESRKRTWWSWRFCFLLSIPWLHKFIVICCFEAEYTVGSTHLITCIEVRGSHLDMSRDLTGLTQCNSTADVGDGLSRVRGGVVLGKQRHLSQSHCMCSSWLHRSHHPPVGGCVIADCKAKIFHVFRGANVLPPSTHRAMLHLATLLSWMHPRAGKRREERAPSGQAVFSTF